jgi:hypothetical protein
MQRPRDGMPPPQPALAGFLPCSRGVPAPGIQAANYAPCASTVYSLPTALPPPRRNPLAQRLGEGAGGEGPPCARLVLLLVLVLVPVLLLLLLLLLLLAPHPNPSAPVVFPPRAVYTYRRAIPPAVPGEARVRCSTLSPAFATAAPGASPMGHPAPRPLFPPPSPSIMHNEYDGDDMFNGVSF